MSLQTVSLITTVRLYIFHIITPQSLPLKGWKKIVTQVPKNRVRKVLVVLSFSFFGCISQVVKMATVEFSVKRKQKLESKKKQEEVNMLEGALSHNVIVKCGSTVEIISRIVELLQAVCLRARRRWCGKNKTALQTFSINEYLPSVHISETYLS